MQPRIFLLPNESVEKVSFLKSASSAGSKIKNDHPLSLKTLSKPNYRCLAPNVLVNISSKM